jgi:phosphoglycerate dehydrogenase-like enzyme
MWSSANCLRWVHVNSAGVDHVLFEELVASDVTVTNDAGVLDRPLAEYVVGLVVALVKDLPGTLERQRSQHWEHRPTRRLVGSRSFIGTWFMRCQTPRQALMARRLNGQRSRSEGQTRTS